MYKIVQQFRILPFQSVSFLLSIQVRELLRWSGAKPKHKF